MIKQQYLGFYNGIIVQNNDPDHAGKVKVWVPHISPTVYNGWMSNVTENKRFKFLGANVAEQFTMIVEDLKIILPWSDIALPLTNEGSSGRYYANSQYGTISDSNNFKSVSALKNTDSVGNKPAYMYEQESTLLNDGFNNTDNNNNHLNPFTFNYKPNSYSNCVKGEFGIPSVGAHVWVFFREGDVNFPVVCFSSYGQSDWQSIYNSNLDYPGESENLKEDIKDIVGSYNHNVDKYRSKYVLNQKGGTFEIINTDHNEKIKLTHYSGSFKEFNNNVTIELATGNDQKLVLGDQYSTVKGNHNSIIEYDSDNIIKGDYFVKIGNLNYNAFNDWKSEMASIADAKQQFDIQRTDDKIELIYDNKSIIRFNSTLQKKTPFDVDGVKGNPGNSVLSYTVTAFSNPLLSTITTTVASAIESDGTFVDNYNKMDKDGIRHHYARRLKTNYDKGTDDEVKHPKDERLSKTSPSTMGGGFAPAEKDILKMFSADKLKKLFEIEAKMGVGGSEIKTITKDKIETVGLTLNDFGSVRIDSKGKYYASEMRLSSTMSYVNKSASPLIEYVHVDEFPGGTYTLTVNNKYNLLVGAGGVNIKSFGGVNIGGSITNISGEQLNLGSRNEINIACDKRISISADKLTLRQKNRKQVLVDSSLGVSKNLIIGGRAYFEQEVYLHHITAPKEIQTTHQSIVYGSIVQDKLIGYALIGGAPVNVFGLSGFNQIKCHPHGHNFDNIPLTLKYSNSQVRTAALSANIDDNL